MKKRQFEKNMKKLYGRWGRPPIIVPLIFDLPSENAARVESFYRALEAASGRGFEKLESIERESK